MLKLYLAPGSCALASLIALEEAGAAFELVRMNLGAGDQRRPEYLKVNPKGRVPALATEAGILTETPAILAYIAQTHPQAGLAPLQDAFAFAKAQEFNAYLCATVHVAHAHKMRGARWVDAANQAAIEAMRAKVPQTMAECFALIEQEMLAGPWVMGEAYGICDPYLYTLSGWLEGDGVEIARFPKVAAHRRLMEARPAVQRALARIQG